MIDNTYQNNRQKSRKFSSRRLISLSILSLLLFCLTTSDAFGQVPTKAGEKAFKNSDTPSRKKTDTAKPKRTKYIPPKITQRNDPPRNDPPRRIPKNGGIKNKKNLVDSKLYTPGPNQVVFLGDKQLGVSDENSLLEESLSAGTYRFVVKTPEGEDVTNSILITISPEKNKHKLEIVPPEEEEDKPDSPTVDKPIDTDTISTGDAAEKILDILTRYGKPLKTNTITLSDWEFVYEMALANKLKNFTAIQIEAQRWFASGQIELAKGNYGNASGSFTKAIEFMPDSAYPYYALGETYTANKQTADAMQAYQKAVEVDPKFALAYRRIGDIQFAANRSKEAISAYESAIANGFDTSAIHTELGKAYKKNKRWEEAASQLEAVVKEAPTGDVYLELGDLYTELKRSINAYESYTKATELSPKSAPAFFKLGEVLYDQKSYQKALDAFETAIKLNDGGREINVGQASKFIKESKQKLK